MTLKLEVFHFAFLGKGAYLASNELKVKLTFTVEKIGQIKYFFCLYSLLRIARSQTI